MGIRVVLHAFSWLKDELGSVDPYNFSAELLAVYRIEVDPRAFFS